MMNYGNIDAKPSVVLTRDIISKSLPKFRRHDDLIVVQEQAWQEFKKSLPLPVVQSENSPFSIDEDELASLVCQSIQKPICRRLAIERGVKNDDFRTPDIVMLLGDNGIVSHKDNHILYQFDVTKCMFSFGNVREKIRMAELDCSDEIVVDLFAGIGYFTLPLLVHAKAKHLYACEWNPDAVDALKKNLALNKVDPSRYNVIEGDNRSNRPTDIAQRVILGILPSCSNYMRTAFECIDKKTGATLHCHDLVETSTALAQRNNNINSNNSKPQQTHSVGANSAISVDQQTNSSSNQSDIRPIATSTAITVDSPPLLNQSLSSSCSSQSTIEKLTAPMDEKLLSSESDKDTSSPVLVERPCSLNAHISTSFSSRSTVSSAGGAVQVISNNNSAETNSNVSVTSSIHQDTDSLEASELNYDTEILSIYEARGMALIARLKEDLEAHDLTARLIHVQPIKSYAPHVSHVVFDIKLEPNTQSRRSSSSSAR